MTTNEEFYSLLKPFEQFRGICEAENYVDLPADWLVVITDIRNSTAAIQKGQYRQVNAVGVASIVAVINAVKPLEIPYVFGGDGASFCLPGSRLNEIQEALAATQLMAKSQFDLSLRTGIVPNSIIQQSEHRVLVGKHQVSKGYFQAAFAGEGLAYAEKLIKADEQGLYSVDISTASPLVDFSGFECRWKDVPSPHGETVSLLVMATCNSIEGKNAVYLKVLDEIQKQYGARETYRPVQKEYLQLTTQAEDLSDEIKIRAGTGSTLARLIYAWLLPWKVRIGRYWMAKGKQTLDTDWGKYKDTLVANTDFRKFDDNLRMVISGNSEQRDCLVQFLEKQYRNGLLVYGIHVSSKALMTCVISDYNQDHVHFVDGSDGGYAMAAKGLKQRLMAHESLEG